MKGLSEVGLAIMARLILAGIILAFGLVVSGPPTIVSWLLPVDLRLAHVIWWLILIAAYILFELRKLKKSQ